MISLATRTVNNSGVKAFSGLIWFKVRLADVLRVLVLASVVTSLPFCFPSGAKSEIQIKPESYGYFDFPTCVRYALIHSNTLTKNRIDIQLASVDLKDAHSEILPTVQVSTTYYVVETVNIYNPSFVPWSVQFQMINWNPYLALLKIKSKSIMVDIAKTSHYDKISDTTSNIAKIFYGIHSLEKSIRGSKQILALVQDKLNYARSRNDQGRIDPLELQGLQNDFRSQQIKVKSLENELQEKTSELKAMIGYQPDYYLPLDTRDAVNQILNGFRPDWITFTDVQSGNLQLKISAKKEQVQSNAVTGAYVALVPQPLLVFQQYANVPNAASGLNLGIGFNYTVWDGFERARDIRRQKLLAQKYNLDREELSQQLYLRFKKLKSGMALSSEKESLSRERAKLADLAAEKALNNYKSGIIDYSQYIDQRIKKTQAHLDASDSFQSRINALIDLATISGGLNKYNAAIRY
ncbi:MAG: TolC family protein [Deltaproteobacteria bacterium]|nr:TolC family protein [Deltaproteobacteria bacterium]